MWLSDTSVKRPILAAVINVLLVVFGLVAFQQLPLREYPDIDPPIVTINTSYPGAAANVVESRITQLIEDRLAGLEGLNALTSSSQDGLSRITLQFDIQRDIDDATNDIRDQISSIAANLPEEAEAPEVQKSNADDQVILWLNLQVTDTSLLDITDYAERYLQDQFSVIDGVSRVRIGGGQEKAMRIWLDRQALAARQLTASDVEQALRNENVELPAGSIESSMRDFTVKLQRQYQTADDFRQLVLKQGNNGYLVRLADVARIEIAATEIRSSLRVNGVGLVGIGIVKQSKGNTLAVAKAVKDKAAELNQTLPDNMSIAVSYDGSLFIERALDEVFITLMVAMGLVLLIIYLFLGNLRATLIPMLTVPVSLIGSFIVLNALGFSLNLLTLLALVLAIGLVVDDAIVVVENIHRRMELGEPRLLAAYRGTRQVAFAVIATTIVLVAVFIPITFLEGDIGRLFTEFAVAIAAAVSFSGLAALTLSPMLASKLLQESSQHGNRLTHWVDQRFARLQNAYQRTLTGTLQHPGYAVVILMVFSLLCGVLFQFLPKEYVPAEDRGVFYLMIKGPEGTSFDYIQPHVAEVEKRLQHFVDSGEFKRLLMRVPGSFGSTAAFNDARGTVVLNDWGKRQPIQYYLDEARKLTADIPGVRVSAVMRQAFGGAESKPVQVVIGGGDFVELAKWRDILLLKAAENPGLQALDHNYKETKPQLQIAVNNDRARQLGVSVSAINNTLQTFLGSKRVTTFVDQGEEYDVLLESEKSLKRSPSDIDQLYVRAERSGQLIPLANLVTIRESADAATLNHYNRLRSITIEANLVEGYALGEALAYFENLVRTELPANAHLDYAGASLDYQRQGQTVYWIFIMALLVVFLVLAGQFENWVHPLIILLTVPLAMSGALLALQLSGQSLNIYSQIGLIILVGLSTKNGILIVEFINQLRDEGMAFTDAIVDASVKRLRPIVMTVLATVMGAVPLVLPSGAGSETRLVIGIVIIAGVSLASFLTMYMVPMMYQLLAKRTQSPHATAQFLEKQLHQYEEKI
jgi:multidrug efflux pump